VKLRNGHDRPPRLTTTFDALAWTLIHFLWQGSVLGAAAFIALRIVRPERGTTRYVIDVAALTVMLATTVATFTVLSGQSLPSLTNAIVVSRQAPAAIATTDSVAEAVDARHSYSISRPLPSAAAPWPNGDGSGGLVRCGDDLGAWRAGVVAAPTWRLDADTAPRSSCGGRGVAGH
jgi:hypothetical protein